MILLHPSYAGSHLCNAPGSFSALMDLYERNYIHLRRLLPTMPPMRVERVSRIPGGLDLHVRITERCRYTSELLLTYRFAQDESSVVAEPNLLIRVYHDARLAEVMAAQPRRHPVFTADPPDRCSADGISLLSRWRINRFLYKWLSYCLRQGHRFSEQNFDL